MAAAQATADWSHRCSGTDASLCRHRDRQELARCRCIAALGACLELVPQEDLDFPWPAIAAKKAPGWRMQSEADADPAVNENYLTWTSDCSKIAQVDSHAEGFMHLLCSTSCRTEHSDCIRLCIQLRHPLLSDRQFCNAE